MHIVVVLSYFDVIYTPEYGTEMLQVTWYFRMPNVFLYVVISDWSLPQLINLKLDALLRNNCKINALYFNLVLAVLLLTRWLTQILK